MRREEPQKAEHIVRDYYIGNTHCIVCDDYCRNQTNEEAEEILDRIAQDALRSINYSKYQSIPLHKK